MSFEKPEFILEKIQSNFFSFMSATPTSGSIARLIDNDGLIIRYTGLPAPLFNGVISTQLNENNLAQKVKETIDFARSRKIPLMWWVFPGDQPKTLENELVNQRFKKVGEMPAMAVGLAALNPRDPVIPGFEIKRFNDAPTLQTWCKVMAAGAGMPEAFTAPFTELYVKTTLEKGAGRVHYLGLLEGRPVATCVINQTGDGVAGVYNVSTLPEARRKGIGRAMTLGPLLEAREAGYKLGTLGSSELGLNAYKSIGFQQYGKVSHYLAPLED